MVFWIVVASLVALVLVLGARSDSPGAAECVAPDRRTRTVPGTKT